MHKIPGTLLFETPLTHYDALKPPLPKEVEKMGKNKIHLKLCSSSGDDDKMTLWVKARKLEAQSTCRVPAAWIRSFDKYSGHHRSGSRFIRSVWGWVWVWVWIHCCCCCYYLPNKRTAIRVVFLPRPPPEIQLLCCQPSVFILMPAALHSRRSSMMQT